MDNSDGSIHFPFTINFSFLKFTKLENTWTWSWTEATLTSFPNTYTWKWTEATLTPLPNPSTWTWTEATLTPQYIYLDMNRSNNNPPPAPYTLTWASATCLPPYTLTWTDPLLTLLAHRQEQRQHWHTNTYTCT